MRRKLPLIAGALLAAVCLPALAEAPVASYIFPAGGRRGTTVDVKVGGLNLYKTCGFEMLGTGISFPRTLTRAETLCLEGPILPLPDSQQAEDYPKDMAGWLEIAADAPLGVRSWRVWTAQGACPSMTFQVGDLPEVVEQEVEGDPAPVAVTLPITVNGRIYPREDVDVWEFALRRGQTVTAEVWSARLGLPLDARLEVLDPAGRTITENDDTFGADPLVCFTAAVDGTYRVKIHDIRFGGSRAHVYRLTLTAGPRVQRVYPLGARRGSRARFELSGTGPVVNAAEFDVPADAPAEYRHRITFAGQTTNDLVLDVDDLPEYVEGRDGLGPDAGGPIRLPAVLNGRIDRPGDVDVWTFAAVKGQTRQFELRAARLGSPLDGVLVVVDAAGKEAARAESPAPRVDPTLVFTPPADGVYRLRVESRFRSRGGPEYAYRLRAGPPPGPDFRLRLAADAVTVNRGALARLKVSVERVGGMAEPIALEFEGLPPGVTAGPASIPAKQSLIEVQLKADAGAPIAAVPVVLRGRAKIGGTEVVRAAVGPSAPAGTGVQSLLLAVGLPTPFKVKGDFDYRWAPRGTTTRRKFTIERNGYDGPIEVTLADRQMRHLQGVSGPTVIVPAGATEFEYVIDLPPWMETGRTCRACVLATAVIKDADGRLHEVGFSSVQPNEQIVAVIEPGPLAIEIEPGSVTAVPGRTATVAVRVRRSAALTGALRLEIVPPVGLRGVSAEPVAIPAGQPEGTITLRFAADFPGPTAAPVLIRAAAVGGPRAVAEARLELVRPDR